MDRRGILCAFAERQDSFVTVSSDNRIKVWDVLSGKLRQQYTEDNHLEAGYTCIAFAVKASKKKKSKKRKTGAGDHAGGLVALGGVKGDVIIWDLNTAEVVHRLGEGGEGHSGKVNDVVFNSSGTTLYSCSDDRTIIEWDLTTGQKNRTIKAGKQSVTKLALSPDGATLASASASIKVWELSSATCTKKLAGHATRVECLAFSPDGKYCLSGAADDRFVNLWDVHSEGSSKRERSALHTFTMASAPVSLTFNTEASEEDDDDNIVYHLSAVTEQAVNVWRWSEGQNKRKASSRAECQMMVPQEVAEVGEARKVKRSRKGKKGLPMATRLGEVQEGAVLSARFAKDTHMLVVRYSSVKPTFERVAYRSAAEGALVKQITLGQHVKSALLGRSLSPDSRKSQGVAPVDIVDSFALPGSKRAKKADAAPEPAVSSLSLAERLAHAEEAASNSKLAGVNGMAQPTAGSLQTILTQALHTNDDLLLETCLAMATAKNAKLIKQTIERLPVRFILPLITRCITKLQAKPNRGPHLIVWIREVLKTHSSYLMSVPSLADSLSGLYRLVDTRLIVFKKLLRLRGRLELLNSQCNRRAVSGLPGSSDPLTVYNDGEELADDEEQEESDEGDSSASDDDSDDDSDDEDEDAAAAGAMNGHSRSKRTKQIGNFVVESSSEDEDDMGMDDDDEESGSE